MQRKEVINRLRRLQGDRTQGALAAELKVSEGHLSQVFAGEKDPGPRILLAMKPPLRKRETEYEEVR